MKDELEKIEIRGGGLIVDANQFQDEWIALVLGLWWSRLRCQGCSFPLRKSTSCTYDPSLLPCQQRSTHFFARTRAWPCRKKELPRLRAFGLKREELRFALAINTNQNSTASTPRNQPPGERALATSNFPSKSPTHLETKKIHHTYPLRPYKKKHPFPPSIHPPARN